MKWMNMKRSHHSISGPPTHFQILFIGATSERKLHELILRVCLLKQDPSESYTSYILQVCLLKQDPSESNWHVFFAEARSQHQSNSNSTAVLASAVVLPP